MYNKLLISRKLSIMSLVIGAWSAYMIQVILKLDIAWIVGIGMITSLLCYIAVNWSLSVGRNFLKRLDQRLDDTAFEVIIGGMAGLMTGILVGVLSSFPLSMIRGLGSYLALLVFVISVGLGLKIGTRRAFDVFHAIPLGSREDNHVLTESRDNYKVLDTSAIIDGRIYDVCLSRFLEGPIIVPTFVVEELQHIADSSDAIRRAKGRRGLELLSKMKKHSSIKIDIIEADINQEKDVDGKLVCLCKQLNASIITNDYNLNKVAELQGIKVLNINELTNAVKIIVYPGETMQVAIIKEGKEYGQGVGYLEDGTMVVVEEANHEIGQDLEVVVTSVFQTAAGRMIFTRKAREIREDVGMAHSLHDTAEVNLFG
ncbi:pili retraction protein pilt [hydrocarbon metagenome]|uniref:Pili retraction protein pilt n=1 Tax=hydrocarbon metagenome TaxID=938273 RepID=A0A0W8E3H6_9ZZZZ